jgi:hypothetical protein
MKTVTVGQAIKVKDANGIEHDALVTNVWRGDNQSAEYDENNACLAINVVFLSSDTKKTDCYGRQSEHMTSTPHRSNVGECPGYFWWQE